MSLADGAVSWTIVGVLAVSPMRSRYIGSIGYYRERMEWFGIGVTLAATVALVATSSTSSSGGRDNSAR